MNRQQVGAGEKFFDSRTMVAVAIVFVIILGWQYYLSKKYPQQNPQTSQPAAVTAPAKATATVAANEGQAPEKKSEAAISESTIEYRSENMNFVFSTRGMGIKNVQLNKFKERNGAPVAFAQEVKNYINETRLNNNDIFFDIKKAGDNYFVGTATAQGVRLTKAITIDPTKYLLESNIEIEGKPESLQVMISEKINQEKSGSFLIPTFDGETVFVSNGTTEERVHVDPKEGKILEGPIQNVSIAAIGKHYFTAAVLDKSPLMPEFMATNNLLLKEAVGELKYLPGQGADLTKVSNTVFLGPKKMELLSEVDESLTRTIDLGIFSWIAKPILRLLKMFYSFAQNYGVAIILVTLLIRLILLPINISSFRSMKKMQEIQPHLKALKEKYKNDPRKLQVETMSLMKTNKVNPLGGCLPMLLQLPIFIALYNVLAQSIELYQAPFIFWIKDLSYKDPYYVLPVLMGITMYIQQKITPTAMDPAQAKAMQIMPVIFSFLMISLPSGLTLYIFVSTLFGIVQQYLIMKEKT